jgi:hypothetical protein
MARMTFAQYLARRKSYTESGHALREALRGMPPEAQTREQVYGWLRQAGATALARNSARRASKDFAQYRRAGRGLWRE